MNEEMICIIRMKGKCYIEQRTGCSKCNNWITKRELAELNATVEDTGPAPRFY